MKALKVFMASIFFITFPGHRSAFSSNSLPSIGSAVVGHFCSTNVDCVSGALCSKGRCRCFGTHVAIGGFCWKKISPEEPGCTYDEQCEAVWPETKCQSSTCKCPPPMQHSVTREGTVCHIIGECPTNGRNSLLYNRNTNTPSKCSFLDEQQLHGHFIGCDDFPEVHDCIGGFCCPTRALVCIQPLDPGESTNESSTTTRWYHDPVSHSCKSFNFTGSGGNSNNFHTKQHCESYCVSRCSRGQPRLFSSSQAETRDQRSSCTPMADSCGSEQYKCAQVDEGVHQCCPSREFICSEWGGVRSELFDLQLPADDLPYSSGSNRVGQMAVTRWYWDRSKNECFPFVFFGQGGNFNNFLSRDHCNEYCSADMCPAGLPLRSSTGTLVSCSSTDRCPSTYTCHHGRCCLRAADLCNLPLTEGVECHVPASSRFWYNASSSSCRAFVYKGCHGNPNSFLSLNSCQRACDGIQAEVRCPRGDPLKDGDLSKRCSMNLNENECPANYECYFDGTTYGCCPTAESICMLRPDEGKPCDRTASVRWFFDDLTNSCRSFLFRGCAGNSNNFPVRQMCMEYCARPELSCPSGAAFHRHPKGELLECQSNAQCPSDHECSKPMFQAVGEGRYCCPTRRHICEQQPDRGDDCGQSVMRYSFDSKSQQCQPLLFLGCGGNSNNFATTELCYNFCLGAACAVSENVFISQSTGLVHDCARTPCPAGYSCVPDSRNASRMVCCGTSHRDVCPDGFRPFISHLSLLPIACHGNSKDVCPIGFHCLPHSTKRRHYCCGEAKNKGTCPFGSRLVRLRTGDPFGCNHDSHCPERATCHKSSNFQSGICCKSVQKDLLLTHDTAEVPMKPMDCPPTHELDENSLTDLQCSPFDSSSCSSSSSFCTFSEKRKRFVCCRRRWTNSNTPTLCSPEAIEDSRRIFCSAEVLCPPSHYCIRRDFERHGFCCPHSPQQGEHMEDTASEGSCPTNSTLLLQSGSDEPQLCSAKQQCPHPYQCFKSRHVSSVGVCCLTSMDTDAGRNERPRDLDESHSCATNNCPLGSDCFRGACFPKKGLICSSAMDAGRRCTASPASVRYFYDISMSSCRQFVFYGCDGNTNNFPDKASCEGACAATPTSTAVYHPKNALRCPEPYVNPPNWPQMCGSEEDISCSGVCISLQNGFRVCCRRSSPPNRPSNFELCGHGLTPVALQTTGEPIQCSSDDDCNGGFCRFNSAIMTRICCTNAPNFASSVECSASRPCKGQSVCIGGRCVCRPGQVQFRRMCYWKCPPKYKNINGVCIEDAPPISQP